jgi:uncharacterized protein (DUF983 family)
MTTVSPLHAGLLCRCPRCGEGPLFTGVLEVRPACTRCGLDFRANDPGDGPAVFVILLLGAIVVAAALTIEMKFEPPLWIHAVLWPIFIPVGAVALLRPFKATLIALQFRHRDL